jgi:hypothetical protein
MVRTQNPERIFLSKLISRSRWICFVVIWTKQEYYYKVLTRIRIRIESEFDWRQDKYPKEVKRAKMKENLSQKTSN